MDTQRWAENLTSEVYEFWKSKHPRKEGVKVFYSRTNKNPDLMIIGYQPGGNYSHFKNEDADRFARGDFKPQANEFLTTDYPMAKRMREFFGSNLKLLEKSVIFPVIFFRSPSAKDWYTYKNRREVKEFCLLKTKEIIKDAFKLDIVNSVDLLDVGVEEDNASSISLLEQFGFEESGKDEDGMFVYLKKKPFVEHRLLDNVNG